ncbi:glycoside hydrolase 100 family protein [Flavobacterium sp.]|uniref:glycoside hydrolase 100 family protein n=1 Tax=Flavobacterium sp. TaxID=239 RepID=UPI003F69DF5C
MDTLSYNKSLELLHKVSSASGFVASAEDTSNYKRVWARDGVICGLAALASGDEKLIETFRITLETLANNQHEIGTIPSNVMINENTTDVSYGGLAGRVDAVTWFIIGICQYAFHTNDNTFITKYEVEIEKALHLLEAWEFNNRHLIYVPLSGNWADEYITDGYVLYDQLLRIWALKNYNNFKKSEKLALKIKHIVEQVESNFLPNSNQEKFHERAYNETDFKAYLPCSFSPSGYKNQFDAFANSLLLLLNIGPSKVHEEIINFSFDLAKSTKLGLVPAFWPPIFESDQHWNLLKDNCKYEFRNFPYEFHNGGSWSMVNGFFALGLLAHSEKEKTNIILNNINKANAIEEYSFYENFNTDTTTPNGVSNCAWSAAAAVLVHQAINNNFKIVL